MKSGLTLEGLVTEIKRQATVKQDFAAPATLLQVRSNGHTDLRIGDQGVFEMNQLAHRQMGGYLGINADYYDLARGRTTGDNALIVQTAKGPQNLFDATINAFLKTKPADEVRLIRTLDGRARAVLSDRYRTLDNEDVAEYLLPILLEIPEIDWANSSMQITDTQLYLKIVNPSIQQELRVGDIVTSGCIITNSEVGRSALSVSPFSFKLWCLNGAKHDILNGRKYHTGKKMSGGGGNGDDAYEFLKDDTLKARDKATMMELRDIVRHAMSEATLTHIVDDMRRAEGIEVKPSAAIEVIQNVTKRFRLSDSEGKSVLDAFLERRLGGTYSMGGIANAVTLVAQNVDSYDRASDLEEIGGTLFGMTETELKALAGERRN